LAGNVTHSMIAVISIFDHSKAISQPSECWVIKSWQNVDILLLSTQSVEHRLVCVSVKAYKKMKICFGMILVLFIVCWGMAL